MGKLIKFLGWIVTTLFTLILLAIIILPRVFDPNDYRDELAGLVKDNTGRDLTLDDDLSLSVFPWLGVRTGNVSLSQPVGLDAPDLLSVAAVDLRVKLLPLLQSKVEVATIILSEPQVHMVVSESGQSSLDGLAGEGASEQESTEDTASAAVALVVAGVELTDGHFIYDDRQAGQRYELNGVQIVTGNLLGSSLEDILIEGVLIDSAQADPVEFSLQGEGSINIDTFFLTLANLAANVVQGSVSSELAIGRLEFAQQTGRAELTDVMAYVDVLPETIEISLPSITVDTGAEILNVPELEVTIDEPVLEGSFSVENFAAPQLTFDLDADAFNVDRYLGNTTEEDAGLAAESAEPTSMALVLPLAALRGLNANGTFNASSMTVGGMKVTDIDVDVVSEGNTMSIMPNAALYNGALRGEIQYVDRGSEGVLTVDQGVYDVDLGALLTDTGTTDRLIGTGTLNIDLTVTETDAGQTNQGAITVFARDGALRGIDVGGILDKVADLYANNEGDENVESSSEDSDETEFSELSGTFNINDQLVTNDDFLMKAPLFRMQGEGQIDLENESLDYLTTLAVVASTEGQGGKDRSDLVGFDIPVRFSGDLIAPSYKIDFGEMLKQLARQKISENEDVLKDKLGEEASGLLKELFK